MAAFLSLRLAPMNLAWSFRACLAFRSSFLLTVLPHPPAHSLRVPLAWPCFVPWNQLTKRQDSPQNFSPFHFSTICCHPSSRSSCVGLLLFHFTDPQGIFRGDLFQAGQCLFFFWAISFKSGITWGESSRIPPRRARDQTRCKEGT